MADLRSWKVPGRTDRLRELVTDPAGYSATQIGNLLGVSKNTVIGKLDRLGLKLANAVGRAPIPRREVQIKAPLESSQEGGCNMAINLELAEVSSPEKTPLVGLGFNSCRFPLGDPRDEDFGFCGARARIGSPYCEAHRLLCYTASRVKVTAFAFGRERGRA